jgi:hypothetical protein
MWAMKSWGWLLIGVVWLTAVVVQVFNLYLGTGMVGIHIPATRWLPRPAALAFVWLLLYVMLLGWLLPLVVGICGLFLKK